MPIDGLLFETMNILNLTPAQLRHAAELKERIAKLQSDLVAILGSENPSAPATVKLAAKKWGMSAAGRARISAAAKLRWAKIKSAKAGNAPKPVVATPARKKFKMSAAAKARISVAAKARWAKIKRAKK